MDNLKLDVLWKAMSNLFTVQEEGLITDKQLDVVNFIQNNTGIKFDGYTKIDAQKFISKNIDKSKLITRKDDY